MVISKMWINSLFIFGLCLELLGFFLPNARSIPIVNKSIYKDICIMEIALKKLCREPIDIENVSERYRNVKKGDGRLFKGEEGF